MKYLAPLLMLLFSLHTLAAEELTRFDNFGAIREQSPDARLLILLFSQPECGYCDLVRNEFLLPLQHQHRPELVIRELKVPGFDDVQDRHNHSLSAEAFAHHYAIHFFPSVLILDLEGTPRAEPLVGISSSDFYGYYLEQAIDQALTSLTQ